MATGSKTGGRKRGTPNKATAAKAAAIAASGLTPLDFTIATMRRYAAKADAWEQIADDENGGAKSEGGSRQDRTRIHPICNGCRQDGGALRPSQAYRNRATRAGATDCGAAAGAACRPIRSP